MGSHARTQGMGTDGRGCGPLYALYAAARDEDPDAARDAWQDVEPLLERHDDADRAPLQAAISEGALGRVKAHAARLVFEPSAAPRLDGWLARSIGAILFGFGYLASFVLFFRADTPDAVVRRLRWAYRTVGVDIHDTESVDGTERTIFRCPYRDIGADRFGRRRLCHDVLDRVDDGYVSFLARHRRLDYDRPRPCAVSECCYSEVTSQE